MDDKLILNEHVKRSSEKLEKSYSTMVHFIILYGAPIWHTLVNVKKYKGMFKTFQRKLLIKVISAYRNVSFDAANVIAGMAPIKLTVKE